MIRKLGTFEQALALSDRHSPFNVVSVLQLENPPAPGIMEQALSALQERHPLMRSGIIDGNFVRLANHGFYFKVADQQLDFNWLGIVEQEMNTRLDPTSGLFRCSYFFNNKNATLILTFHHAIMDAASGMHLLIDLLRVCAGLMQPDDMPTLAALEVVPAADNKFPPAFRGIPGFFRLIQYAISQMVDEMQYRRHVRGKRTPPVHPGGRGFPLAISLPESLVDDLSKRCRVEKVTFNSLLNATLLLATNRWLYSGNLTPMRIFSFADLRPYTVPPTPVEPLANYITMLRFTEEVSVRSRIWEVTKRLHTRIHRSLKKGDKYPASRMSKALMTMFITMKSMRMGASALNYSGAVPMGAQYGRIEVTGLHAFLSSYDLGPEVSAQARLFNHELWLDFMFLESDMERETAEKIAREVRTILEEALTK